MSRPPPSCGHPTSEPYIDSVPRTQHPISMPYSRHEPRQLLPQTEYGPLLAPPRIPVSERSADRYMLSSDTHQPRPQVLYPSQSGETRHYNTYEINPAVGHAHDYDSQRRAYDVESQ